MSVGQLFTDYFVTLGIRETTEWQDSGAAFAGFRAGFVWKHEAFRQYQQPNEAVTEQDLIRPTLELLGWTDYLPRQGTNRNEDDATSKGQVVAPIPRRSGAGYACAVEESKGLGPLKRPRQGR